MTVNLFILLTTLMGAGASYYFWARTKKKRLLALFVILTICHIATVAILVLL